MTNIRRRSRSLRHPVGGVVSHAAVWLGLLSTFVMVGCSDDIDRVREIQAARQSKLQRETKQDHLGEMHSLMSRLVELNPEKANRQIRYHLNQWRQSQDGSDASALPELASTLVGVVPQEALTENVSSPAFFSTDIKHLRDAYLFQQIVRWTDTPDREDELFDEWLDTFETDRGAEVADKLRTAVRLFDWTVRNVSLEPLALPGQVFLNQQPIQSPPLPGGLVFQGPGYRQSDYQTVWRGVGDSQQRAGVFDQLCRQAGLSSAILAVPGEEAGQYTPWVVGVLLDDEIYLFEPELGLPVPGPDEVGIATLSQARKDASVLRRLKVAGFFDYPLSRSDVQQCIALLNLRPEAMSARMKALGSGLTGERRMVVYVDTDESARQFDEVAGIAGVRVWPVPIQAELYRAAMERHAEMDPLFAFWYQSRWAIMDADIEMPRALSRGRWAHLHGRFADDDDGMTKGARTLYGQQRAPEFEIEDLRIKVDLQKAYGIRRELGMDTATYNNQVLRVQSLIRLAKRTASYWLSLVQFDDGRIETAKGWLDKRVLDENQPSPWETSARYNLARANEQLGDLDAAVELYKTEGDPQEHGNRIRARLLQD